MRSQVMAESGDCNLEHINEWTKQLNDSLINTSTEHSTRGKNQTTISCGTSSTVKRNSPSSDISLYPSTDYHEDGHNNEESSALDKNDKRKAQNRESAMRARLKKKA